MTHKLKVRQICGNPAHPTAPPWLLANPLTTTVVFGHWLRPTLILYPPPQHFYMFSFSLIHLACYKERKEKKKKHWG